MKEGLKYMAEARPNWMRISLFMFTIMIGQFAGRCSATSNLQPVLTAKFDWNEIESEYLFMLNVFGAIGGEICGAVVGS